MAISNDASVLKEFLVSLGFRIDPSSFKKFQNGVAQSTATVVAFGTALVATATSIVAFVGIAADRMEDLYWSSQRLGSSVSAIQSFAYQISQMGGTAAGAKQSLESLGQLINTNPGFRTLAHILGATGTGAVEIMQQLGTRFAAMGREGPFGTARAWRYAQMFGIDYQTFWAMMHPENRKGFGNDMAGFYKAAGINADQSAKNLTMFNQQLRKLEAELGVIVVALAVHFLPLANQFISWTIAASKWLLELDRKTHGVSTTVGTEMVAALAAALVAWRVFNLGFVATPVGLMITAVIGLVTWLGTMKDSMNLIADLLNGKWDKAWEDAGKVVAEAGDRMSGGMQWLLKKMGFKPGLNKQGIVAPDGKDLGDEANNALKPAGNGPAEMIAYYMKRGLSRVQADALVAHLMYESGGDIHKPGDKDKHGNYTAYGLAQWHHDRQIGFSRRYDHDIRQSTLEEQLDFALYELRQGTEQAAGKLLFAAKNASAANEAGFAYERPGDPSASRAARLALANKYSKIDLGAGNTVPDFMAALKAIPPALATHAVTGVAALVLSGHSMAGGDPSRTAATHTSLANKHTNISLKSDTHVTIENGPNAKATAAAVGDIQTTVNGDIIRQMSKRTQ